MGIIVRGVKNAFRNGIRTFSVIVILALSISMALVMFISLRAVDSKIASVKNSIGNTITVSPAGVRGFEGGGNLLTTANVSDISKLPHVTSVTTTLSDRLRQPNSSSNNQFGGNNNNNSNSTTTLTSAIDPGSFGNRQNQFNSNSSSSPTQTFSVPINVTGTNDINSAAALNASQINITSGTKINATSSDNVAMVGTSLAAKNNLKVGDSFTAYNQQIKVIGIFDAGNTFANAGIVMPIKTMQTLSGQTDQINNVIVLTDSIDNLSTAQKEIQTKLGSAVDVVTSQDRSQNALTPLQNIRSVSQYSLYGALVAGAVIVFLIMLMIVRERKKEIGVLKAIGASDSTIIGQFVTESMVLTVIGGFVAMLISVWASGPVMNMLVSSSTSSSNGGGAGGRVGRGFAQFAQAGQNSIRNLQTQVGWEVILYGLGVALLIAIIGSILPVIIIGRVKPAEVIRSE